MEEVKMDLLSKPTRRLGPSTDSDCTECKAVDGVIVSSAKCNPEVGVAVARMDVMIVASIMATEKQMTRVWASITANLWSQLATRDEENNDRLYWTVWSEKKMTSAWWTLTYVLAGSRLWDGWWRYRRMVDMFHHYTTSTVVWRLDQVAVCR